MRDSVQKDLGLRNMLNLNSYLFAVKVENRILFFKQFNKRTLDKRKN